MVSAAYALYDLQTKPAICYAGFGPLSDGVPELLGDGGESERLMPDPPRKSEPLMSFDKTAQYRRLK